MNSDIKQHLEDFQDEVSRLKRQFGEKMRPRIFDMFKAIFESYPEIEAFRWDQSNNLFNDEGYYSGIEYVKVQFVSELCLDEDENDENFFYSPDDLTYSYYKDVRNHMIAKIGEERFKLLYRAAEGLSQEIEQSSDPYGERGVPELVEVFLMAFGDGVRVTVTRDGFDIGDYDY